MKKKLGVGLAFVAIVTLSAFGGGKRNNSLNFSGAIGVDAVSNVVVNGTTVTVSPNVVRGISPSGQIWRIADLYARITVDRAYSPLYSAGPRLALPLPAQIKLA